MDRDERGTVFGAALSIRELLANGQPFPGRDLIIFLTFGVILVTLVLQGLSLPPLIRALGLSGADASGKEEEEARRQILEASLAYIEARQGQAPPGFAAVYEDLAAHERNSYAALTRGATGVDAEQHTRSQEISLELLKIQRNTVLTLRTKGQINDTLLRKLERDLDLQEVQMNGT
jgi:NhaP-type Na+/H+ or K+/H+ antiporter